jgi:hypothetical protein
MNASNKLPVSSGLNGYSAAQLAGIRFLQDDGRASARLMEKLDELKLRPHVTAPGPGSAGLGFSLSKEAAAELVPQGDTMQLCRKLGLDTSASSADLEREIVLAMLAAPQALEFPSYEEFASAVNIRGNIVRAARQTQLAFHTSEAERPADYWQYTAGCGFTILPGKSLIHSLRKATQPDNGDGTVYSFSCYRATEYVVLLAIAQELEQVNRPMLEQLQAQWERRAIMSGEYHEVFLHEFGSADHPLPLRYYVPGDRVWFRNPDEHSSDASGYEGSWVIYLGGGLFANFWKRDQPYSFDEKCVEIFHWRHGIYLDLEGEPRIDESIVESAVRETLAAPEAKDLVLRRMARLRDQKGVYADGGCVDISREFARYVCPGTSNMQLPSS